MKTIAALHERLELSLLQVEVGTYSTLEISDRVYPHWTISHIQRGHVQIGDGRWLTPGSIMVHPPGVAFSEQSLVPGVHQFFFFDLASTESDALNLHRLPDVVLTPDPAAYARAFDALHSLWHSPAETPARGLRLIALTLQILALILDAWHDAGRPARPETPPAPRERFAAVVAFMQDNLAARVTRDDLAARVFLHPGYFDRVFRAAYGVAPMQMLRDLRLRRVQTLLETTQTTLDSIAEACGLGDAAHLSRAFRARFGQSPGRYRESAKQSKRSYIPRLPD